MSHAPTVRARQLAGLHEVGERWRKLSDRRAETVRLLRAGGPMAADEPAKVDRYRARQAAKQLAYASAGVTDAFFFERKIGPTLDLDEYPPDDAARIAGIPVGRIVDLGDGGQALEGFATGFLIAPGLILTNHHVFGGASECAGCGIQFGYEYDSNHRLLDGPVFGFDTTRFFYTNEALDCSIVAVAATALAGGAPLDAYRNDHLSPALGKILVGQAISIIQYPDGGPKKYGVRDNELLVPAAPTDVFLQYTTDTLPGSSGSPAFNQDWEVVALHHSSVPEMKNGQIMTIRHTAWKKGMPDTEIHWVANEGVRVSSICEALIAAKIDGPYRDAWADLIATFQEDFSMLPIVQSQTASEATVVPASADAGRMLSVVVNGTANFYVGHSGLDSAVAITSVKPLTGPPAGGAPALEKKLVFDPQYSKRPGFKTGFLKVAVPLPGVVPARRGELLKKNGQPFVLKYHHYSLVMNQTRRMQMWSAVNVDYTPAKRRKKREEFGTDTWVADPRIAGEFQIEDQDLYDPAKKFDRGHIVRREDTAWGDTAQEEIFANSDSFHWTNCTPQHEQFNRAVFEYHGLWGELENHIQQQAQNVGQRMSIFGGPVLNKNKDIKHDFGGGEMLVPRRFWKIVIVTENAASAHPRLRTYGFILDQTGAIQKFGLEKFSVGDFETYQVRVPDITGESGVTFAKSIVNADAMAGAPDEAKRIHIDSLDKVRL